MATSRSSNGSIVIGDASSSSSPPPPPIIEDSRDSPSAKSQQQPLFANPFMAPFLPQAAQLHPLLRDSFEGGGDMVQMKADPPSSNLLSQDGGAAGTDFRVNPLTGGYFLSSNQYQEMMQQYVKGLMLAANGQDNQNDMNDEDKKASATSPSSKLNDAFEVGSATANHPGPLLSSFAVDPENVACSLALMDVQACSSSRQIDCLGTPPTTSTNLTPQPAVAKGSSEHRASSPPHQDNESRVKPLGMTKIVEAAGEEEAASTSPPEQQNLQINEKKESQMIAAQAQNGHAQQPEVDEEKGVVEDPKAAEQEELKAVEVTKGPTVTPHNHIQHDQRTTELIKKQINEIEREISRRIQNKNVKKMDDVELAQLLSDHGFGNFVGFGNAALTDQSGIPYRPPGLSEDISESTKASLDQLRSSFSPPPHGAEPTSQEASSCTGVPPYGASPAFMTVMPQATPPSQQQNYFGVVNGGGPAFGSGQMYQPSNQQQIPSAASPFYAAAHLQQHLPQQFYPHPQFGVPNGYSAGPSPNTPPVISNITAEMAAALLQQLQQQNPGLIQNLVEQQQQQQHNNIGAQCSRSGAAAATIPAPPLPNNNVSRRSSGTQQQNNLSRKLSAGSTTSSATCKSTAKSGSNLANPPTTLDENGWFDVSKGDGTFSNTSSQGSRTPAAALSEATSNVGEDKENGSDPIWVMRDSYLKRLQREEQRNKEMISVENGDEEGNNSARQVPSSNGQVVDNNEELNETDKLLVKEGQEDEEGKASVAGALPTTKKTSTNKKEVMVHEPAVLIEGVLFRARYLGSTQLVCDGRPTKTSRMAQAQEAVARVKAPDGEIQPSTEIDLFISTEKIMVLNTDLQDILMDHSLRSISYIADIGDLVVLMARRVPQPTDPLPTMGVGSEDDEESETIRRAPRVVCHVFESEEASFIAQSIGQAFQVAYVEFLRANGIDDPAYLREIDYQEVLNSQELMGEELEMFARKETQKDVVVPKKVGEALGVVVVESGWGSMLPTVVVANMAPGGPASRSNQLNIGDQIIAINGISLVGLPLASAQQNIKNAKTSTAVRLTIVSTPPVVEVRIKRPDTKYQLGFSVQNGVICSLLRGGIAERGGIRVGHRIIEINHLSVVAVPHERIVNMLATATGEIHMKTMPTSMFRLLTGQEVPNYI